MKKYILIMLLAAFTFSCETTVEWKIIQQLVFQLLLMVRSLQEMLTLLIQTYGINISKPITTETRNHCKYGIDSQIWVSLELGPTGQIIRGTEEHSEFLKMWFDLENPKWNTYFSYSMKVDGQQGEWVISGAQVKKTVDGQEVTLRYC